MSIKAKATLKKVLWIVLGILVFAVALAFIVPLFVKDKKTGDSPLKDIVDKTKLEVDKAEIDAQIEVLKARGEEQVVIAKLEAIKEETDRKKRLEKLSELLD